MILWVFNNLYNINFVCLFVFFKDSVEENEGLIDVNSIEYQDIMPELQPYLMGRRSLKKGFNAWAGRRGLEHLYKRLLISDGGASASGHHEHEPAAAIAMLRQRRKPWGGMA